MAKIIGVVQLKGGTGRSTIATNLAGSFEKDKRVALIDCDIPQASSASWGALRDSGMTVAQAKNHNDLLGLIKRLSSDHDIIVLDAPPRIAELTRAILILSDLTIIPLGGSAVEVWATNDLVDTINQAKEVKPNIDARIVWNRFRNSTKSAKELSEAIGDIGLTALDTKLGFRVAYSEALARGLTVVEWGDPNAKKEMLDLVSEITSILNEDE